MGIIDGDADIEGCARGCKCYEDVVRTLVMLRCPTLLIKNFLVFGFLYLVHGNRLNQWMGICECRDPLDVRVVLIDVGSNLVPEKFSTRQRLGIIPFST